MSVRQIYRMYASRQLKPVILQHMEVIFSHTTALDFLRMWSCNHPLALRAFHDLRSRDVGHLPSSHLKGFSSLARAADTEAAVRAAIESAKRPSLKRMLEELWDNATVERPLHVLARPKEGRHPTKRVRFHQIAVPLPRGAFLEIAPGIALCSPELVFVQMAESLSAGELIALGYELCGCYPLDAGRSSALVRTQLATPGRLAAFAKRAERIKGSEESALHHSFPLREISTGKRLKWARCSLRRCAVAVWGCLPHLLTSPSLFQIRQCASRGVIGWSATFCGRRRVSRRSTTVSPSMVSDISRRAILGAAMPCLPTASTS